MEIKRVTLRDVAEKLKVSHTTVAMALRNHHTISLKRRVEVRQMAEKMGYCPDPFLSALAAYRKRIGPSKFKGLVAWARHWRQPSRLQRKLKYEADLWRGASLAAGNLGFRLEEILWEEGCSGKRFEQILLARGVRGVLIPPHDLDPNWTDFDWSKFSIVRFSLSVSRPDSNLVTVDHFRAMIMAVGKIKEYGYQRIGLVIGEKYNRRLEGTTLGGFLSAQELFKLRPALPPLKTDYGTRSAENWQQQKAALHKWLKRHTPDAILTTDTETPDLLQELGYDVPRDIAVAGTNIDDIRVEAGIDQHSQAIGRIAMETLAKQLNLNECGEPADPARILIEGRWQDGRSLPSKRL